MWICEPCIDRVDWTFTGTEYCIGVAWYDSGMQYIEGRILDLAYRSSTFRIAFDTMPNPDCIRKIMLGYNGVYVFYSANSFVNFPYQDSDPNNPCVCQFWFGSWVNTFPTASNVGSMFAAAISTQTDIRYFDGPLGNIFYGVGFNFFPNILPFNLQGIGFETNPHQLIDIVGIQNSSVGYLIQTDSSIENLSVVTDMITPNITQTGGMFPIFKMDPSTGDIIMYTTDLAAISQNNYILNKLTPGNEIMDPLVGQVPQSLDHLTIPSLGSNYALTTGNSRMYSPSFFKGIFGIDGLTEQNNQFFQLLNNAIYELELGSVAPIRPQLWATVWAMAGFNLAKNVGDYPKGNLQLFYQGYLDRDDFLDPNVALSLKLPMQLLDFGRFARGAALLKGKDNPNDTYYLYCDYVASEGGYILKTHKLN